MIRMMILLFFGFLLLGKADPAAAQMVNVRMVLPAGVNFNPRIIQPQPKEGEVGLRWVEMVVQENIQVSVSLQSEISGKYMSEKLYILNNGTTDFGSALSFESGRTSFQMDDAGMLIRNISPQIYQVRAWLGIPKVPGLKTVIEYH